MRFGQILWAAVLVVGWSGPVAAAEGELTQQISPSIRSLKELRDAVVDAVSYFKKHPKDKPADRPKIRNEAMARYQAVRSCVNTLVDAIVRDINNKVEVTADKYSNDIDGCKSKVLDFTDFINRHSVRFVEAGMLEGIEKLGPAIGTILQQLGELISGNKPERERLIRDLEATRLPDFREIALYRSPFDRVQQI